MQAYFTLKIFYKLREKFELLDNSFADPYSYHDATDSMLAAQSFDRVHPLMRVLPEGLQGFFFRTLKWIVQFVYYPVPPALHWGSALRTELADRGFILCFDPSRKERA